MEEEEPEQRSSVPGVISRQLERLETVFFFGGRKKREESNDMERVKLPRTFETPRSPPPAAALPLKNST
jgi:hypothetical protein